MTTQQKLIKTKVGLLELGRQLGSVSQACRVLGYSRDSFYRFQQLSSQGGETALEEISRKKPLLKNRVAPEIEMPIVDYALAQPAWGQLRVANELAKQGIVVSAGGVRCVWQRQDLETFQKRLKALEAKSAQGWRGVHRGAARLTGTRPGPSRSVRRIRERVPRLLRRAGYVLRRHVQRRGPRLPGVSADVHRHLQQGDVRQAVRGDECAHRSRSPQ